MRAFTASHSNLPYIKTSAALVHFPSRYRDPLGNEKLDKHPSYAYPPP